MLTYDTINIQIQTGDICYCTDYKKVIKPTEYIFLTRTSKGYYCKLNDNNPYPENITFDYLEEKSICWTFCYKKTKELYSNYNLRNLK